MKTSLGALGLTALLALAGCNLPQPQADTVRNFTLAGPPGAPAVPNATQVRPVQVAGHLRERALAVRVGEFEVAYDENFRWAESLEGAITQLLRNRLGSVGGGAVVTVQVQRCEPNRAAGNEVEFSATYTIFPGDKGAVRQGAFTAPARKWDGRDFGALVARIREDVGDLGDAIAAAVAENK